MIVKHPIIRLALPWLALPTTLTIPPPLLHVAAKKWKSQPRPSSTSAIFVICLLG